MTQTVPDISPLMPMHQDPLLVSIFFPCIHISPILPIPTYSISDYYSLYSSFNSILKRSMVACQKGPTRHAYAWPIGPFWQDTLEIRIRLYKHSLLDIWEGSNPNGQEANNEAQELKIAVRKATERLISVIWEPSISPGSITKSAYE